MRVSLRIFLDSFGIAKGGGQVGIKSAFDSRPRSFKATRVKGRLDTFIILFFLYRSQGIVFWHNLDKYRGKTWLENALLCIFPFVPIALLRFVFFYNWHI